MKPGSLDETYREFHIITWDGWQIFLGLLEFPLYARDQSDVLFFISMSRFLSQECSHSIHLLNVAIWIWKHIIFCICNCGQFPSLKLPEWGNMNLEAHNFFIWNRKQILKTIISSTTRTKSITHVFPTLEPIKPPTPSHSNIESWISLFKTHLRKTHPGNRGFGLTEREPFFNILFTWIAGE